MRYLSSQSHCVICPFVVARVRIFEDEDRLREGWVFVTHISLSDPSSNGWSLRVHFLKQS